MPTPQPGIFAQGTRAHRYLEFDLRSDAAPAAVNTALAGLRQPSVTAGGANIVVGFGPDLWRRITPSGLPDGFTDLPEIDGVARTPHDVWIWIHGTGPDILLDIARAVAALLAPVAKLVAETDAFVYQDSHDLTGFVDGTENPPVEEAFAVATIASGQPGAGGAWRSCSDGCMTSRHSTHWRWTSKKA